MNLDLTDIVTVMQKVDANHDPSEANALLTAGAVEIARLRALGRKIARPWIDGGVSAKRGWIGTSDSGGAMVQMTEEQIAALEEMRGRHSSEEQVFLRRIFHSS